MSYLYQSNISPRDRFDQIELQMDNGSTTVLRQGLRYDLTANETSRARRFVVLIQSGSPADTAPEVIARLPIYGSPVDGDVPIWSEVLASFYPGPMTGGTGGGTASASPPVRFEQAEAVLGASRPHHFVGATHYERVRITTDSAMPSNTALVELFINGDSVGTLTLNSGLATNTFVVDIGGVDGDALVVSRLSTNGGGIVVELDDGVFTGGGGGGGTGDVTTADLDAAIATHSSDTTGVHGIADTSQVVLTGDSRLTNSRPPNGSAGGVLGGTYPSPSFAIDMATQSELDTHSADTTAVHGISNTANIKGCVYWTAGAVPARPSGFASIEWIGPSDPISNAVDGDTWVPTAGP